MKMSTPRLLVVAISIGFVIASVGGLEMAPEQAITVRWLAGVGIALLIAAAAVKGVGRKALDSAARNVR